MATFTIAYGTSKVACTPLHSPVVTCKAIAYQPVTGDELHHGEIEECGVVLN